MYNCVQIGWRRSKVSPELTIESGPNARDIKPAHWDCLKLGVLILSTVTLVSKKTVISEQECVFPQHLFRGVSVVTLRIEVTCEYEKGFQFNMKMGFQFKMKSFSLR